MTPIAVPDEDARLMREFALGDARGFEQLYHQHKGGVYRYFLRSVSDTGLAEELAQDVWAALIRARATYQAEAKFTTWLYRLAHNRLIDHYRRANLVVFTALDRDDDDSEGMPMAEPVHPAPGPEDAAAQRAAAKRVVLLVEQLPPAQREALLMQLEGGLTLEEIADATGQGFETIKSRLRYAFAKLREGLKDHV